MNVKIKKRSGQSGTDGNEELRTQTVKFLCSPTEQQRIIKLAHEAGETVIANYVRAQALADRSEKSKAHKNAVLGCQRELTRLANHCRDIIKQLHFDNEIDRATFGAIKDIQNLAFKAYARACNGERVDL